MKFGIIKTQDANGYLLAHSVRLKNSVLKKGTRLNAAAIAQLLDSNVGTVMAARLDEDDISEDEAAERIASAISGTHVRIVNTYTGRVNIFAEFDGVFTTDYEWVKNLNRVDDAITIATLPRFSRVTKGQMVATVKIIPFSVPQHSLLLVEEVAAQTDSFVSVAPFLKKRVGLVLSRFDSDKDSVIKKRTDAVNQRVTALGSSIEITRQCLHEQEAVSSTLTAFDGQHLDQILVFGASAIVDKADVIPAALIEAGGEIVRLGMPVDPGNLLLLGRLKSATVIGIPSCASSIKENGFDWVLERICAGIELTHEDFIDMAVGGLLKEIPTRPHPRENNANLT